jgi:hypothetical protein
MPRPAIFHGKGMCNCDYGTPLTEALDCGCCGAAEGVPCVVSKVQPIVPPRCPHDNCPPQGCFNSWTPPPAAPSLPAVSSTKRDLNAEITEGMDKLKELRKVCTPWIPCCALRGLKRPYKVCHGAPTYDAKYSCTCHEGRP